MDTVTETSDATGNTPVRAKGKDGPCASRARRAAVRSAWMLALLAGAGALFRLLRRRRPPED